MQTRTVLGSLLSLVASIALMAPLSASAASLPGAVELGGPQVGPAATTPPALTLVASIYSGNPYSTVGGTIVYHYLVTSSGGALVGGPITITDDQASDESCPNVNTVGNLDANLDPAESITCTASHTVTQADLNAGSLVNHATAHGVRTDSNDSTATATAQQLPALSLSKSIFSGNPYSTVGGIIVYHYLVTNSGNVSLPGPVTITDDQSTDETCPSVNTVGNLDANFDPGESMTCTASHTVTQADLYARWLTNHATAHAGRTDSDPAQATARATGSHLPMTGFWPGTFNELRAAPLAQDNTDLGVSMDIPNLGLNGMPVVSVPLVDGTWDVTGVGDNGGWLQSSVFPGDNGNSVIAGHVTDMYGYDGPFAQLDQLAPGDEISIHASGQVSLYRVVWMGDFAPDDLSALNDESQPVLTLVTCSEPNYETHTYDARLVVRAELVEQVPEQSITVP